MTVTPASVERTHEGPGAAWRTTSGSGTSRPSGTRSTATPEGGLYYEELMGEEGFSSDSSLLYHRGLPSAIVGARAWELPDLSTTPNHPLLPRHLRCTTCSPTRTPSVGSTS